MERNRFSLLLLEPGEIYFEDFSVHLLSPDTFESKRQYGRLKMCSKSLVFDPQDTNLPILKMQLKDSKVHQGDSLWPEVQNNSLCVECNEYTEMLEGNVISPYTFKRSKTKFLFLLNYGKIEDILPQILQLQRACTLHPPEQSSMIAAIVYSRQSRVSFDTKWLEDIFEKVILETQGNKVSPLVVNPGRILLTSSRLYFQPYNNVETFPVLKINLRNITRLICRRFLLKQVGVEIDCDTTDGTNTVGHLYLVLKTQEERDELYQAIMRQPVLALNIAEQEIMTLKWQNHSLSTFDYLLYLNSLADRSFNDLTQYPVFPWVIADYTSSSLDLSDPRSYRDLKKPIGAINAERLARLQERREEMQGKEFLYGSHYSTPGFVLFYLIRKYPHYMLCLQNGRFDQADRMFNSVADVWRNVMMSMSDFKELIPEFYDVAQGGDFLLNTFGINFGHRHDNTKVQDVELPPWADSAADFVGKLREALESDCVSENLHHWIDLVFGYKQRGAEARLADNVFYYLCYEGGVDLDSIQDIYEKHALEVQIMEFGQIPKQIFKIPHPQRLPSPSQLPGDPEDCPGRGRAASVVCTWRTVASCEDTCQLGQHKDLVTAVAISPSGQLLASVGRDAIMKLFSVPTRSQTRSLSLSTGIASCVILPDDKTVVLGSFDDHISVYDVDFGKIFDDILAHEDAVTSLCWGERGQCLVSGSWDCSVIVWRDMMLDSAWHRLKPTQTTRFDRDAKVTSIALDRDCVLVASGTEDGEVCVANIASRAAVLELRAHDLAVSAVSFSPDGSQLVSCSLDGSFKVYDLLTGMAVYSKSFEQQFTCLAWDGSSLILGSQSGFLFLWDLIEVQLLAQTACQSKPVTCISVNADGTLVATGENKSVIIRS